MKVPHWTLANIQQRCNIRSKENHAFHHIMCFCTHLSLTHISKSHTFVAVVNMTHVDTTFLTWLRARNLILKLPHNDAWHPVFFNIHTNTIVHTWASHPAQAYVFHSHIKWHQSRTILTTSWSDISSSSMEMISCCCCCRADVFRLVLLGDISDETVSPVSCCTQSNCIAISHY